MKFDHGSRSKHILQRVPINKGDWNMCSDTKDQEHQQGVD